MGTRDLGDEMVGQVLEVGSGLAAAGFEERSRAGRWVGRPPVGQPVGVQHQHRPRLDGVLPSPVRGRRSDAQRHVGGGVQSADASVGPLDQRLGMAGQGHFGHAVGGVHEYDAAGREQFRAEVGEESGGPVDDRRGPVALGRVGHHGTARWPMTAALSMAWPSTSPTASTTRSPGNSITSYQSPPTSEVAVAGRYRAVVVSWGSSESMCGSSLFWRLSARACRFVLSSTRSTAEPSSPAIIVRTALTSGGKLRAPVKERQQTPTMCLPPVTGGSTRCLPLVSGRYTSGWARHRGGRGRLRPDRCT